MFNIILKNILIILLNKYIFKKISRIIIQKRGVFMIESTFVLGMTGPTGLIIISIIALILFGPKKLPQFGRAIGSTLREFKSATEHITDDDEESLDTPSTKSSKQRRDK